MPSGERSQVWYPNVVALLRAGWHTQIPWEDIVALRRSLQAELDGYRRSRGIGPPTFRCPKCGVVSPGSPPKISVRAMLLALSRFGIEPADRVRERDREWKRYRAINGLDQYGHVAGASGVATKEPSPCCPAH